MKKQTTKSLTAYQKRYLKHQVLQYFLLLAVVQAAKEPVKTKPPPKEQTHKAPEPEPEVKIPIEVELASVLLEDSDEPSPRRRWPQFRLPYRRLAKVGIGLFVFLMVVVVVQLVYPRDRSLPLSRLESHGYLGFADRSAILKNFEDFDQRVVTVHTHSKSITTSYKDLGVTIEPFKTVDEITEYSVGERLIPFSILTKGIKQHSVSRSLDDSQLKLFVENVIAQASKKPISADVSLEGTQFLVAPSEEGYEYQESVLRSKVLRSDLSDRGQIVFTPTILKPDITTDDANAVVARMQLRIDNPLLINAEGKSMRIEPPMMAGWVDITPRPDKNTVQIVFNRDRLAADLRSLAAQVDLEQVPTVVTYLNGIQAGRRDGSVGKVLQFDDLVNRVVANTSPITSTLEASVVTVPPAEQIDRRYSKDSQGLQTLLEYWTASNRGEYSIDVRTLNGRIVANKNPYRLMPAVGVYQSYIASLVYARVASGSVNLSAATSTGQSVEVCLQRMLQEADAGCIDALGSLVGWGTSDSLLKAQGFDSTTLAPGASLTTAADASQWFIKVSSGNIATTSHANKMLDSMSRGLYRSGIPAGSPGIRVASKYGSFGRVVNDMALVYHPSGSYVISVFSEGSTPGLIADLTREINKLMSQ